MSDQALQRRREAVLETAKRIDETASAAMVHFSQAGSMAAELQVAQAMVDLRAMMTPEVMVPIMALQNTDIGFRTDKTYPVETVRDVVIEAKLRGFHTIGNEFNIIAGRFYAAQKGFRRKLTDGKTFPGLNNFRDIYEVPRLIGGDKGALVKCKASWTFNGKQDSVEFDFPVKLNAGMGSDGALGKAERKLCKRVHDLLSGISTPDGDLDDNDIANATDVTPPKEASAPPPKFTKKEKAEPPKEATPAPTAPPPAQDTATEATNVAPAPAPNEPAGEPPFDTNALTPAQAALEDFVVNETALDFDTFKRGILASTWFAERGRETWTAFSEVPDDIADRLVKAPVGFKKLLNDAAGK